MERSVFARARFVTAVAMLLAGLLTGCAGGEPAATADQVTSPSVPEGPEAADREAADREVAGAATGFSDGFEQVIGEYAERAQDLQAQTQTIPEGDEQRLLELLGQLQINAVSTREDLAALAVPAPVAAEMTTILQLLEDQATVLADLTEAVHGRDDAGFQAATSELVELAQHSGDARRRMDAAIAECGSACS